MIPEYREGFASSQFLLTLARTLDMFFVIDIMKNYKNSLNNDLSMYKRNLANIKNLSALGLDDETSDHQTMYSFLGTRNVFAMKLKERLVQIPQYDELLIDLVNFCCQMIDNHSYLVPNTKYKLIKVCLHDISTLGGDICSCHRL